MWARLAVMTLVLSMLTEASVDADTAICHRVSGRGNTGNGYNLITVTDHQLERHRQHPEDLIPAPNGFCLVLFPPTTTVPPTHPPTTTTRPPEATTVPSQPPTTRPGTTPPTNPPAVTTTAPGTFPLPPAGTLPPSR